MNFVNKYRKILISSLFVIVALSLLAGGLFFIQSKSEYNQYLDKQTKVNNLFAQFDSTNQEIISLNNQFYGDLYSQSEEAEQFDSQKFQETSSSLYEDLISMSVSQDLELLSSQNNESMLRIIKTQKYFIIHEPAVNNCFIEALAKYETWIPKLDNLNAESKISTSPGSITQLNTYFASYLEVNTALQTHAQEYYNCYNLFSEETKTMIVELGREMDFKILQEVQTLIDFHEFQAQFYELLQSKLTTLSKVEASEIGKAPEPIGLLDDIENTYNKMVEISLQDKFITVQEETEKFKLTRYQGNDYGQDFSNKYSLFKSLYSPFEYIN